MNKNNKKGFTLTEMIVVIAIIGILAGVLIPSITGYIKKANRSNDEQLAASMTDEIERYCIEYDVNQKNLLGTDIKTILAYKNYDFEPSRKDWTYVYDSKAKSVKVIDIDEVNVDQSYTSTAADPTNYEKNMFLIGEGKNDFEQAVKKLLNINDITDYDSIKNNAGKFQSLIEEFNPTNTLYVSNSLVYTKASQEEKVEKIVYLTKTIHLPEAKGISFADSSKNYKSAIIKTCDENSEFKTLFTRLKSLNNNDIKEIDIPVDESGRPAYTFKDLDENTEITISNEIVKVEKVTIDEDPKIETVIKLVITYYNETGVYARGTLYYGTIQAVGQDVQ